MKFNFGCCCGPEYFNLMKLDPSNGDIVWQAIIGDGTLSAPNAYRVEALLGTDDVIVGVAGTTNQIHRVDSTGASVWNQPSGVGNSHATSSMSRAFGCDGTYIITANSSNNGLVGRNYSGTSQWTQALTSGFNSLVVDASTFWSSENPPPYRFHKRTNSTGAASLSLTNAGGTIDVAAIEPSSGDWINGNQGGAANFELRSGTTGLTTSTASFRAYNARFGPGGYSFANLANICTTGGTGITASWTKTTINGATISGMRDTCSEDVSGTIGYFFVGKLHAGTTNFHIVKTDASGNYDWSRVWGANTGSASSTYTASGCCISDDGYLYVSGTYTHV